jgi:hypothetical protein
VAPTRTGSRGQSRHVDVRPRAPDRVVGGASNPTEWCVAVAASGRQAVRTCSRPPRGPFPSALEPSSAPAILVGPKAPSHGFQRQQCQGGHVAPGRRAVRPVRRTTTFAPRGVAAPTEGQSTQVPGQPAEGFLVSRGSCVGFRRGEHGAALRLLWREN